MARVVLSGGAGFLGSHLTDRLLARGDQVVCIDNLITGSIENISHLAERDDFTFLRQDVCDPVSVGGHVDAVMHLASPASPIDFGRIPIEILMVGGVGTKRMLDLASEKQARFFLASTSEVYGDPLVHPQVETYWGNVNPIGPRAVYDESKRYAEAMTMAYHRSKGAEVRIARIFNTYGPRMRPDDGRVVTNFITQALRNEPITLYGDGSQTRSFCYVDDQVEGHLALLDGNLTGPINIGNDHEFTVKELAEVVIEVTNSNSDLTEEPLPQDDPTRRRPDLTLARSELGWEPKVDLVTGVTRTAEDLSIQLGL